MPIVQSTPTTPPIEAETPVQIAAPEFRGVTVDTVYEPADNLLTNVEGALWVVNYYSQVLGKDNALSGQSLDRDATVQQYWLIQDLELRTTTPLTMSQNTTTKAFTNNGTSNVFPCGLIPNEGDMFIASLADGTEGLFEVTNSDKRSMFKDAVYVIDYTQVAFSEQDGRINDLNTKVVKNTYFERDFLIHGQKAIITYDERQLLQALRGIHEELVEYYFDKFFSKEFATLLLPGQKFAIYDPLLTKHVLKLFRGEKHKNLKYIREFNMGGDTNFEVGNVWEAFLNKRRNIMRGGLKEVGLTSRVTFTRDPMMDSVRYSGVDYIVYPKNIIKSEDYQRDRGYDNTKPISDAVFIEYPPSDLVSLLDIITVPEMYGLPNNEAPAVNPVSDLYIFSQSFYDNTRPGQSAIELAINDYFDNQALNLTMLMNTARTYPAWGKLTQFYQLPFLMALIQIAIRRM
jgi:hypothetical protein